jgi:Bacterial Ig-like domain
MAWLGGWIDPELEELFRDDPELLETAQLVHAARPQVEPDPRFRNRLRGQLLAEAARGRGARGLRRWWRLGPAHIAWGGAAVGVVLIGATVLTFLSNHPADQTITAFSDLTAQHSVNPNNVIQVRFNQPMDQAAVENGVRIQPATEVSKSWNGNTLVITPVHHLSGNTPYTVTILQSDIRAASGVTAATPISIRFATAPTPPAAPSAPPTLLPTVVGQAGSGGDGLGGSLFFAPDGSLVATTGVLPAAAVSPPSSASASPTPSPTATPEGVIDSGPAGQLVDFPASGTPSQLGPLASAAAFSPNGTYLAAAVDDGNGGSRIVVSLSDGSQRSRLIDSPTPVTALTWSSNDRIVYTDGATIQAVDLSKQAATLYTVTSGGGTITVLDPGGAYAYVAPVSGSGGGALLNIDAGTAEVLQGSTGDVAFSSDGSTVVWSDGSTSQARLWTQQVSQNAPASVSVLDPSATIGDITVDQDGDEAAYLMASGASTQLVVAQLPSGTPLAVEPASNATGLALSAGGDQVAFISNNGDGVAPSVEQATVPGATAAHAGPQIPAAAKATVRAFVDAQVRGDLATLAALSGPNANAGGSTPQNLSRAYVISTYLQPDGGVSASIELIVDPSAAHASAEVASETLTLSSAPMGHGYIVSSILSSPLRDEASGPHVVQVTSSTQGGVTMLDVSFDSDLNPGSVAGAFLVLSADGTTLPSTTVYDADSRTATVTISSAPAGVLTLEISTALDDVDGQALGHSFQTQIGTNS